MQRKDPLRGKIFARCIPKRLFAGLFGCMARISCQSQLISDAWRANLARKGRFSRPRPLSGCMERKTCHGLPPGNAPWRNLATDRHSGTHRASILSLPVRPRTHQGAIPPPSDAGERIAREYCHRRMPKSASRVHFAIVERPGTHQGITLPWPAARKCTAATPCHGSLLQECFSTTYCQEGPRLPRLAAKSQWCHEVGRPRPNVTSANSTTRANTSKKP